MHGLFFEVRPKTGQMKHYFDHVAQLKPVLAGHTGLIYLERFVPCDDPEALLSHQLWRDEAAIAGWRREPAHRKSQTAGRHVHFESYRIRVGPEVGRDAAPDAETSRLVVAIYGPKLPGVGRLHESVTVPGRFLTLADAANHAEALRLVDLHASEGTAEARLFSVSRDYTLTDRAQAPT
ncbi:antibiotic biosynthesis monooxygenase family protein [Jannaschia seohaensis]|uniref:Heme-degrading monooxygenase HmoA n=1 Tax=Jannaschia seohaensis TaxID=475081 RepID=A0A2Y9C5D0_9RHOB|nr:antibiotic biosynthesis monooxygenase family protein [Jannaschia seohaensis]PWJ20766.1 heme-degrading monooxygenase HmoA [Jannaschia seohaensis]SSA41113.1 Heme-degrading monooxygenase HmoA [Jannaschia seohaensis]